jgi:hypothetical protein
MSWLAWLANPVSALPALARARPAGTRVISRGSYAGPMTDPAGAVPHPGMIISVLTGYDVMVMYPNRFLAAARRVPGAGP